jgi:hypothetical protein
MHALDRERLHELAQLWGRNFCFEVFNGLFDLKAVRIGSNLMCQALKYINLPMRMPSPLALEAQTSPKPILYARPLQSENLRFEGVSHVSEVHCEAELSEDEWFLAASDVPHLL